MVTQVIVEKTFLVLGKANKPSSETASSGDMSSKDQEAKKKAKRFQQFLSLVSVLVIILGVVYNYAQNVIKIQHNKEAIQNIENTAKSQIDNVKADVNEKQETLQRNITHFNEDLRNIIARVNELEKTNLQQEYTILQQVHTIDILEKSVKELQKHKKENQDYKGKN